MDSKAQVDFVVNLKHFNSSTRTTLNAFYVLYLQINLLVSTNPAVSDVVNFADENNKGFNRAKHLAAFVGHDKYWNQHAKLGVFTFNVGLCCDWQGSCSAGNLGVVSYDFFYLVGYIYIKNILFFRNQGTISKQ